MLRPRVTNADASERVLDDATVAELRQLNEGNMLHVATVTTVPTSGTRKGGALVARDPIVLLESVPCRLSPRKRPVIQAISGGDQMRAKQEWELSFVAGTEVPDGAVAVVRARDGTVLRTVRIGARSSSITFDIGARYTVQDVSAGGR